MTVGNGGGSATEQAKEHAQEATQQARREARTRVSGVVDERSTQAGEQLGSTAVALKRTSSELREQGQDGPAQLVENLVERVEGLGGWLRDSDGDALLHDVEAYARRNPTVVLIGGLALGFAASRFVRASSDRRSASASTTSASGPRAPIPPRAPTASTPATSAQPGAASEGLLPAPTPPHGDGLTTAGQGMGNVGGEAEGFTPPRGA